MGQRRKPDRAPRGLTGLAAEDDKASNPVAISLLGADAAVVEADVSLAGRERDLRTS